jgi:hypothetical protein
MAEIDMHGGSHQEVAEWHTHQAMLAAMKFKRYSSYKALADWKKEREQESDEERARCLVKNWAEARAKIKA